MNDVRLIVNADDCGMSRGITDGIVLAHRYGFLTSTSLMANMSASEYAVGRLKQIPKLGVGVHLNICAGNPILPVGEVPSLIGPGGQFHPPAEMIGRLWSLQVRPREIEAEFRAQIQWIKERGVTASHADSHHHMHIYPGAIRPFLRALRIEGIRSARTPRSSIWPQRHTPGGPYEGPFLRRLSVQGYRAAIHHVAFRKLNMPASRISFSSRARHDLNSLGEQWQLAFASLTAGTFELACHPGLFQRDFSETDRLRHQREEELRWLTSSECREVIERRGIRLITYRDLVCESSAHSAAAEAHALS